MEKNKRYDSKINAMINVSENTELGRLYKIVKDHAKEERIFLDRALEEVFKEYVENHKLGRINAALKDRGKVQ